ncbi:MAG: hypothetical protein HKN21_07050, partial [Candidatus Eisenbacteria bacterium]|nr:hypothetical protein [Candidatus Eisenbacteria bacterium]
DSVQKSISYANSQSTCRSAMERIAVDLRGLGFSLDLDTVVPIETASEYRITFLSDLNSNGSIGLGERITYFIDDNTSNSLVSGSQNTHDRVLRRVISTGSNPLATPQANAGQIIAYGLTQRDSTGTPHAQALFKYLSPTGTNLMGTSYDPDGAVYGKTVEDSNLGKPVGSGATQVKTIFVNMVIDSEKFDNKSGRFPSISIVGSVTPRNL